MPVVKYNDIQSQPRAPGITTKQLITADTGSGNVTLGELVMQPGSSLIPHIHRIEEAMFVTEGNPSIIIGSENFNLDVGSAVLCPAGIPHQLKNDGKMPAKIVFFFPGIQVYREEVKE